MIDERIINDFKYGTIDSVEADKIPDGAASASKNFFTTGNTIELRRGSRILGTEISGNGKNDGVHVASGINGTEVLFRKRGRKIEYFDDDTEDWIEVGSNIVPVSGLTDKASFANYASLAGYQVFVCGPNFGPFKIMVANPGSYTDLTDSTKNFQGYIKIQQNRMWLWGRLKDKTGVYGSYIDAAAYTTVTGEATTSLSGTLAFKAGGAVRTCFAVTITITSSGEIYTDNYDGTLTGSLSGTGTINYTSGAYTLSNSGAGTADYQWENSNNTGITDFTKSVTRTAGQGFVFRQDDGGDPIQNVFSLGSTEYCMHTKKTWALTLTADDTNATNFIYRENVGIPNRDGGVATGDGIYFIDTTNSKDPELRILAFSSQSQEVIPRSISKGRTLNKELVGLSLADFVFSDAVMTEFDKYILLACKANSDSGENDRVIVYNKENNALDIVDFLVASFTTYDGALVAGDSVTDNVLELLSGLDDSDSAIDAFWESSLTSHQIKELKKTRRLVIDGNIGVNQEVRIYLAFDRNSYVEVDPVSDGEPAIKGGGSYVDRGEQVHIGAAVVGKKEVGGGGSGIEAFHYTREISINT